MVALVAAALLALTTASSDPDTYTTRIHIDTYRWNSVICVACQWDYHPVCGTDGKTYLNSCILTCFKHMAGKMGLEQKHRGECGTRIHAELAAYAASPACDVECSDYAMDPVCGSDNRTHYNSCYFNCHCRNSDSDCFIRYNKPCLVDSSQNLIFSNNKIECLCSKKGSGRFADYNVTFAYHPICAGRNYNNECHENCAKWEDPDIVRIGDDFCEDQPQQRPLKTRAKISRFNPCNCPMTRNPVCAEHNRGRAIAKNECFGNCGSKQVATLKKCAPQKSCQCRDDVKPVCSGRMFADFCDLACYQEFRDGNYHFISMYTCHPPKPRDTRRTDL